MKAVLLLSGGIDSAVVLYKLLAEGYEVKCLTIDYGQKNRRWEAECVKELARIADCDLFLTYIDGLVFGVNSPLLAAGREVPVGHYRDAIQEATVVPNRNMVFIALAAAYAYSKGFYTVAYGAQNEPEGSVYRDAGRSFFEATSKALRESLPGSELLCPLIDMPKRDVVRLGARLGVPFEFTRSCYASDYRKCGRCGACTKRSEAFVAAGVRDPSDS